MVQTYSGDWIVSKCCTYALVFPCAVTIALKLGDSLIFIFSRALMLGKYSLVFSPLVVASHCCCHFAMVLSDSCRSISLFVVLLLNISLFLVVSLASLAANSFSLCPAWVFIHVNSMYQFSFYRAVLFLLISSVKCFLFLAFLRECIFILLSVNGVTVRGVMLGSFIVSNLCSALSIAVC